MRAMLVLIALTAIAAADTTKPMRFNTGKLYLRPNEKVLIIADKTTTYDYDVAAGVIVPVLPSRHVEWRQHAPYFLSWDDADKLLEHCHRADTLAETGTFTLDPDSRLEDFDGRSVDVIRGKQRRRIDLATCKERGIAPIAAKKSTVTASYDFDPVTKKIRIDLTADTRRLRSTETPLLRIPDNNAVALAFDRLAIVVDDRTLFVWDWSKGAAGKTRELAITDLDRCQACQLEFRDASTLVYGHGLIDVATARYTRRPDSEVRQTKIDDHCAIVQARSTWQIVSIIGHCGERDPRDHSMWIATEHVAIRDADFHAPGSWGAQVIDLDHARVVFTTTPETYPFGPPRPTFAQVKREWLLVAKGGWLPLRSNGRWFAADRSFDDAPGAIRFVTEDGIFIRREEDRGARTFVAFWSLDGTKVWDVEVATNPDEPAVGVASHDRILVGGAYYSSSTHSIRSTAVWSCTNGHCLRQGRGESITNYDVPNVVERVGLRWRLRDLDSGKTTALALDDCGNVLLLPGSRYACVTGTREAPVIRRRTADGLADGPEVPLSGYWSGVDVQRAGRFVYAYGDEQAGGDPYEVRRIDLASGDVVRVFFDGDAAIATYADDSVEFFGDRASLAPYIHCMRDGKIYVGAQSSCKLREVVGRFAK